jgi:hypothetical protein
VVSPYVLSNDRQPLQPREYLPQHLVGHVAQYDAIKKRYRFI